MKKILNWDSAFFGFNVALISEYEEPEINNYIQKSNADNKLTYVFVREILNHSILDKYNGNLADTKLLFEKNIDIAGSSAPSLKKICEFDDSYSKESLYQLAYISGQHSRFKLDNNIPLHKFKEMYKLWVDNSISGEIASKVYIYVDNQQILGFITLQIIDDIVKIGLIAVDPKSQGQRIGSNLIAMAENYSRSINLNKIQVPTQQRNEHAVKFYMKNNFRCIDKIYVYHFWNNQLK